jgi:hypothetical protein
MKNARNFRILYVQGSRVLAKQCVNVDVVEEGGLRRTAELLRW